MTLSNVIRIELILVCCYVPKSGAVIIIILFSFAFQIILQYEYSKEIEMFVF